MSLFVAAIGATLSAIFELTIGQYLRVGDAQPHLVLIFAIIWAVAAGLEGGLVWAFVGGIALDVLAPRPFGVSSFALIVCVGLAATLARMSIRFRPIAVVPAVAILSLVYSMTLFLLLGAMGSPVISTDPVSALLPGVIYDSLVGVAVGPLLVLAHDRFADEERMDW